MTKDQRMKETHGGQRRVCVEVNLLLRVVAVFVSDAQHDNTILATLRSEMISA